MRILGALTIAFGALRSNRLRTFLTVLGIVIGISSVIVILSAGQALKGYVIDELNAFGSGIIQVEVKVPSAEHTSSENAVGLAMGVSITTLKESDAEAIATLPNIEKVYSAVMGQAVVSYKGEDKVTYLYGVSADFINIDTSEVAEGRFFTKEEDEALAPVVVLGSEIKEKFFGPDEAVGKYIKVGRRNYKVIGVMAKRGSAMFFNWDEMIYLPLRTLQKRVMGIDYITFLVAQMKDPSLDQETKREIEALLRQRHNISSPDKDDFAVTTQEEMQEMLDVILGGVQLLLLVIASISLLVGGIGIMNIMYVSVAERTYEIGLRKAVGASQHDILWQFLWEAVVITLLGGVVGMVLGVMAAIFLTDLAHSYGYNFSFTLPWWSLVVAVGFATAVGLVFGIYPAKKAAALHPIDALRKVV